MLTEVGVIWERLTVNDAVCLHPGFRFQSVSRSGTSPNRMVVCEDSPSGICGYLEVHVRVYPLNRCFQTALPGDICAIVFIECICGSNSL